MPGGDARLHIGLVEFHDPTLLFLGQSAAIEWLAGLIESQWSGDFSSQQHQVRLTGLPVSLVHAVSGDALVERDGRLEWRLSPSDRQLFPEKLRVLARSAEPGHQYLDSSLRDPGIQIVASKGEYDPAVVFPASGWENTGMLH